METSPELSGVRQTGPVAAGTGHAITGGGPAGNEELTAIGGVILFVLLAVLGVTIVRVHQLIWLHLFLGLLLIGPVLLKMASTGYRFARYYTRDPIYVRKGAPALALRLIAPVVVLTTIVVFVSGVILLFVGPANRGPLVAMHKASFIVWLVSCGLHALGHLPYMPVSLRAVRRDTPICRGAIPVPPAGGSQSRARSWAGSCWQSS
jgi:hypothetical protein